MNDGRNYDTTAALPALHTVLDRGNAVSRVAHSCVVGRCHGAAWLDAMLRHSQTSLRQRRRQPPQTFRGHDVWSGISWAHFFPQQSGSDYVPSEYLQLIDQHRSRYTVISGLSHAEQNGNNGHASSLTWLTAARHPGLPGFRNSVSLDQYLVEATRPDTRFPSLVLGVGARNHFPGRQAAFNCPASLLRRRYSRKLFVAGTPAEIKQQVQELKRGRSILDTVGGMASDSTAASVHATNKNSNNTSHRCANSKLAFNSARVGRIAPNRR